MVAWSCLSRLDDPRPSIWASRRQGYRLAPRQILEMSTRREGPNIIPRCHIPRSYLDRRYQVHQPTSRRPPQWVTCGGATKNDRQSGRCRSVSHPVCAQPDTRQLRRDSSSARNMTRRSQRLAGTIDDPQAIRLIRVSDSTTARGKETWRLFLPTHPISKLNVPRRTVAHSPAPIHINADNLTRLRAPRSESRGQMCRLTTRLDSK